MTYGLEGKSSPIDLNPDMSHTLIEVGVKPSGKANQVNKKAELMKSLGRNLTRGVFYFTPISKTVINDKKIDFSSHFKYIPHSMLNEDELFKLVPSKLLKKNLSELERKLSEKDTQWFYDFIIDKNKNSYFKGRDQLRGALSESLVFLQLNKLPYELFSNISISPLSNMDFPRGYSTEVDAIIEHEKNRQRGILKYFSRQKHLDTKIFID